MIFYSRESPDFELFEKQHHGTQKSNKNNTLPKCTFLALWLKNAKSRLPPEWVRPNCSIFFLKEFLCVWTRRNFYIEISGPVEYSTTAFLGSPHNWKTQKKSIFRIFLKCDLDGFRYRFRVQNNSKTPQGPISGHISSFRPISATLSKFEFLAKIDFLAIFRIFDF